MAWSIT
ncbi:Late transcription factor VLTF-4 (1), partial [Monkeypox virus]